MKKYLLIFFFFLSFSVLMSSQTKDEKTFPCLFAEQHKPLDFWIGEWDVSVKDKKTATSSITKSEGGCTLHEDYRTLSEYYGRSMKYFDPEDKKYTQIWVDKFNSITTFKEVEARKGYLKLQSDNGKGILTNMDYTLDETTGNVTQTMEGSKDGGKTWKNTFTGVYKKKSS